MGDITVRFLGGDKAAGTVLCLGGILAKADQYGPLMPVLEQHGAVIGFDYTSTRMNFPQLSLEFRSVLRAGLDKGKPVKMIGSSMGRMQIPFIMKDYRDRWNLSDGELSLLHAVIVDAPTGANTMPMLVVPAVVGPLIASSAARKIFSGGLGDKIVGMMTEPPKDEEISIPSAEVMIRLAGRVMTDAEWKEWVKQTAIASLTGWSGDLWQSWLSWMIKSGNRPLAEASSSLTDIKTTIVACTHKGNGVVAQPTAGDWYQQQIPHAELVSVEVCHAAYLQQQAECAEAMTRILAQT